jgi:predicted small metal-binding protein
MKRAQFLLRGYACNIFRPGPNTGSGSMGAKACACATTNLSLEVDTDMARKFIDCREYPSETNCTVAIAADSDKELLEIAVQHAVSVHGHKDTPELRRQLGAMFKQGAPSA